MAVFSSVSTDENVKENPVSDLRIVHLDRGSIGPDITITKPDCPHHWTSYEHTEPADVITRLQSADVAVLNKVAVDAAMLEQLPDLKMIAISATGFDKIDIEACRKRGITVSNIRAYAKHTVPEHTFALMLALRRGLKGYIADVDAGMWQVSQHFCLFTQPVSDLNGATLGVIGNGAIGSHVARIAEAFGMRVLKAGRKNTTDIPEGYTDFDDVITESDVITLHCPLTAETKDLIGTAEFRRMKRHAIILNTSRGGLVNEADLVTALRDGEIAGAGLDVLTVEPPSADHIMLQYLDMPNLIVTPHTGWASCEAMDTLWKQLIMHIDNFAKGKPSNNLCEV